MPKSQPWEFEDAKPPARSRKSEYADLLDAFVESGRQTVKVTFEGKAPQTLYMGLQKTKTVSGERFAAVKVSKRGDEVFLTLVGD